MSLRAITDNIKVKVQVRSRAAFARVASRAYESIQVGSELTGSKGQPVDHGELRASYQLLFPSPTTAAITTDSPYARQNEDGIARPGGGPYRQKSPVGGRWSIALTVAALPRIIEAEAANG
ncbi:MAG TPA: hypothetical protein VGM50_22985 [Gemmatimonadaceae bacterium]|jgi:hypothetical protein